MIVGGGSAGCVLAARLSEDPSHRVRLLEAGPDYPEASLPDGLRTLFRPVDWPHEWRHSVQAGGRARHYKQGRGIGGGSSINGGVALRAEPDDFRDWPAGWGWDGVLPFFRALETDHDFPAADWHGDAGPIPVRRWPQEHWVPVQQRFHAGCRVLGFDDCADHNAPGATGVGAIPMNRVGLERISAARAYLEPARKRPNLSVEGEALVRRVCFEGGQAVGVELHDGRRLPAGRVVVTSGVLQTPTLLWRSGVGPAEALGALGVPVVAAAPVGERLTDHFVVNVRIPMLREHHTKGAPALQTFLRTTAPGSARRNDLNLTPFVEREPGGYALMVSVSLQLPVGAGRVREAGRSAGEGGDVDFPFAEVAENCRRVREGLRLAWQIGKASELARDPAALDRELDRSDADLDAHVREAHGPFFHGVGTCGMGDERAVADPTGAVRGVSGLYVADASVIPKVPRTNTNLVVMAVAEKIAAGLVG